VYLPKAATWFDFWTGKKYRGGQTLNAQAPIETMPLYVKAGSIVPMGPVMQYATEKPASNVELRIYPGANGQFEFYEDENDTYNYEKGKYATFKINWNDKLHQLTISDTNGNFPGMLKQRTFNIVLINNAHGSGTGAADKFDKTILYNGKAMKVSL
jgi:alpha-D-xyloside xylohydrolase